VFRLVLVGRGGNGLEGRQAACHDDTTPSGTFTVTVPPLPSGGVPKLALVAQARDAATGLDYGG